MGIPDDFYGWALIILGAASAIRPLTRLVKGRRNGARYRAILASIWSDLFFSLTIIVNGILALYPALGSSWLEWILVPVFVTALAFLLVPGILSRRSSGVPWWRFWAGVIPSSSAAADTTEPGPTIVLDATTSGLIERIEKARFSTTRLSGGYDEEEVDTFLDKVITVLSKGGQPDQAELRSAHFTTTRLRPGYVTQDVDSFLQEIALATLS
jgi:DivIVA domain-containing protein